MKSAAGLILSHSKMEKGRRLIADSIRSFM